MAEHRSIPHRLASAFLALPLPVLARLTGSGAPIEIDGRILNRRMQALQSLSQRLAWERSADDVGLRRSQLTKLGKFGMFSRTNVHVTDRVADLGDLRLPVRIYRRFGLLKAAPAIVYFHGGGWATGDLESHDGSCRLLADESDCVVVAVDYRLAPEHPFPAAVEDACAAHEWVWRNADGLGVQQNRIGVMGDSAGATLAAVVAQQYTARDRGKGNLTELSDDVAGPVAQCLVYPATDAHLRSHSTRSLAEGFFLSFDDLKWFRSLYLTDDSQWSDVRASPLLATDLAGLPPAVVITAGFDPLRDEGIAYADAMADAGVEVLSRCYDDMVHGFFGMGVFADARAAAIEVCAAVGDVMHPA